MPGTEEKVQNLWHCFNILLYLRQCKVSKKAVDGVLFSSSLPSSLLGTSASHCTSRMSVVGIEGDWSFSTAKSWPGSERQVESMRAHDPDKSRIPGGPVIPRTVSQI